MRDETVKHTSEPGASTLTYRRDAITVGRRGRDLKVTPPAVLQALDGPALQRALFGPRAPEMERRIRFDARSRALHARPLDYAVIHAALIANNAAPIDMAFDPRPALPFAPQPALTPRPYQTAALAAWRAEGCCGVVTLPTGAGKTYLGALAIAEAGVWTLVVAPTIDLLGQWKRALTEALAAPPDMIGVFGGGAHEIAPITVITYDSALVRPEVLWRYGFVIFDECHHLPAPTYRQIAEGAFAPVRLGLSATPVRADQMHTDLDELIGPEVYRRDPETLAAAGFLAGFRVERVAVALSPDERTRYEAARDIYREFVRRRRLRIASPADFQRKILWASARDPEAREAMRAWRESRALALDASAKLAVLEEILSRHREERVLIFSEYNALVAEISHRFLIPRVTHDTPISERRAILEGFRTGRFTKLVTGRVLNEGVDIPECGVAVIVSGNATPREYIQRLGRILRPKVSQAILYELVTEDTTEERASTERRRRN
ncbi:MAG TPA: DEAD/DEAH box helicase [Ktedonobacterales bacterium]